MKIGTLTTGAAVETVIKLNYCPAYIYYIAGTQVTSIRITVEGDGTIFDSDADGITGISGISRIGPGVTDSYYIPIADGFISNKVTEITITNSATQTPDIFGHSLQPGSVYYQFQRYTVLADSQYLVEDFAWLGIKSPTTSDIYQVEFGNGHMQRFESTEFKALLTLFQNDSDSFGLNNVESAIRVVNIQPSTTRTIYIMSYRQIGDIITDVQ